MRIEDRPLIACIHNSKITLEYVQTLEIEGVFLKVRRLNGLSKRNCTFGNMCFVNIIVYDT